LLFGGSNELSLNDDWFIKPNKFVGNSTEI